LGAFLWVALKVLGLLHSYNVYCILFMLYSSKEVGIYDSHDHDSFDRMYLCFGKIGLKTFGKATSFSTLVIIEAALTLRDISRPAKWVSTIVVTSLSPWVSEMP